ncbi:MAG: hypothetical protein K2W96_22845 [Gemmataceae bacterium]|nr:hypothetical protein [Gemmataceae bacterium]
MDRLEEFLEAVRAGGWSAGKFRSLLWVLVAQPVRLPDGEPVSSGLTFRQLAALLRRARWDIEAVRELGLEPAELPPRDREKAWFAAITRAGLGTPEAKAEGEKLAKTLRAKGYGIGPEER